MLKKLILFCLLALVLSVAAILFLQPEKEPEKLQPTVVKVEELPRDVLLYFVDPSGRYLLSEAQQIEGCEDDRECIRNLFAAMIDGPEGDLLPVIPAGAQVLDIELRDDLAVVDFNETFVHAHPGGSLSELLTVYAMINSLAVNFPYLKQLQILVAGEPVATLKGHVSLTRPITADFSYSRLSEEGMEEESSNE